MLNLAWFCDVLLRFWSGEDAVSPLIMVFWPVKKFKSQNYCEVCFTFFMFRLSVGVCQCGCVMCIFCWDSLTLVRIWCLSFLKIYFTCFKMKQWSGWVSWLFWWSVALNYIKENKTVTDGTWNLGEGKFICFSFIPVHEDLQNCDEHIALIEMKSALFGVCVLSSISLCIWHENFLQSNAGVLSVLIPGECNFIRA